MKTSGNHSNIQSKQGTTNKPRPDVKDDLVHHKN